MQLLDAPTRLAELRGPKILVTGPTAIGKTSLLKTLSPDRKRAGSISGCQKTALMMPPIVVKFRIS